MLKGIKITSDEFPPKWLYYFLSSIFKVNSFWSLISNAAMIFYITLAY